jgi:hypothetical protein
VCDWETHIIAYGVAWLRALAVQGFEGGAAPRAFKSSSRPGQGEQPQVRSMRMLLYAPQRGQRMCRSAFVSLSG